MLGGQDISLYVFQTRTGHLSHSTWAVEGEVIRQDNVSNPDGPPLPFHRYPFCGSIERGVGFKPGRATSPIPPMDYCRSQPHPAGFKPGRATSPIPPPPARTQHFKQEVFQTRTGHLSHSTRPDFRLILLNMSVSNPDGPPLPFHRESLRPGAAESRGFQTRTGHLSHSTTKAVCTPPRSVEVSNPDGPPLPFHPGMDPHEASIALQVSNPDGPPLPFHRCCCCNRKCNKGSFKPGRATSPIPPSIRRRCFWPTRAFQTRTGHLSHSTTKGTPTPWQEQVVSNPDGPPLPFHR